MNKKYEKIDDEFRSELEKHLQTSIVDHFRKETFNEHFYKYEVQLQNIRFVTYMSDEELEASIKLTIDLLEEMKAINNDGIDGHEFRKKVMDIEKHNKDGLMRNLQIWDILCSGEVAQIIGKIDEVRRVGGAYAMLISNPGLKSAIHVVYERLVDHFDDEKLYCHGAYFLLRAVMKMHSDEIEK